MFGIGDTVMHPSEGICGIEDIRLMQFGNAAPRSYYILRPEAEKSSSRVYMPSERGDAVLRRLLTKQDILHLIHESAHCSNMLPEDSKLRKEAGAKLLAEGDYSKIIHMIIELRALGDARQADGKKPCASDEALLTQAEQLVHQEFSYVLHLSSEATVAFIRKELAAS